MLVSLNKTESGRFCFAIHNPKPIKQKIPRTTGLRQKHKCLIKHEIICKDLKKLIWS